MNITKASEAIELLRKPWCLTDHQTACHQVEKQASFFREILKKTGIQTGAFWTGHYPLAA
jgi:hypothetical protein